MSLNDGLVIFSCEDQDAELDYRTFGSILPRHPIIQAIVRPIDGRMAIIHCLTSREAEIESYVSQVLESMKAPYCSPLYDKWDYIIDF